MKTFLFFFLLIFCLNFDIDEYYRKIFTNVPLKIPLNLTNKTSSTEIPKIQFYKDIPKNTSILNISKEHIIISCSKYPYDEMIYQYIWNIKSNDFVLVKLQNHNNYLLLF